MNRIRLEESLPNIKSDSVCPAEPPIVVYVCDRILKKKQLRILTLRSSFSVQSFRRDVSNNCVVYAVCVCVSVSIPRLVRRSLVLLRVPREALLVERDHHLRTLDVGLFGAHQFGTIVFVPFHQEHQLAAGIRCAQDFDRLQAQFEAVLDRRLCVRQAGVAIVRRRRCVRNVFDAGNVGIGVGFGGGRGAACFARLWRCVRRTVAGRRRFRILLATSVFLLVFAGGRFRRFGFQRIVVAGVVASPFRCALLRCFFRLSGSVTVDIDVIFLIHLVKFHYMKKNC